MRRRIRITCGTVQVNAVLNDSKTAEAIWNVLPIRGSAQRWGEEIYFRIPVALPEEQAKAVVEMGDLGYWPPGNAFCLFFGPTPASRGSEIRPASPVNVFGKMEGDPKVLSQVRDGTAVTIERLEH
jgi:hypothetical protein